MDYATAEAIESRIRALVAEIAPEVRYVPKYGGLVMCYDPTTDNRFVGGIFRYKAHVSLEFSHGATFEDPDGLLEGGGKHRRHLKFVAASEVDRKGAAAFLAQAFARVS